MPAQEPEQEPEPEAEHQMGLLRKDSNRWSQHCRDALPPSSTSYAVLSWEAPHFEAAWHFPLLLAQTQARAQSQAWAPVGGWARAQTGAPVWTWVREQVQEAKAQARLLAALLPASKSDRRCGAASRAFVLRIEEDSVVAGRDHP